MATEQWLVHDNHAVPYCSQTLEVFEHDVEQRHDGRFIGGCRVGQYMTPEELLAITPEFLGKAILHRRERLAAEIPEQLDARSDELPKQRLWLALQRRSVMMSTRRSLH